jgi:hypothetical protein
MIISTTARARLIAVDDVNIEASPHAAEEIAWFYGDLVGLQPAARPAGPGERSTMADRLCFRCERHQLCVSLVECPHIETVATRVHFEVTSLEDVARALDERGHAWEWLRGLSFTDRSLMLLDPAGNRVRLRKLWPFQPL